MHKVCNAFFNGSVFYRTDTYHFVNQLLTPKKESSSLTTMLGLAPVDFYGSQKDTPVYARLHIYDSYVIQEGNFNPSQTLMELLFSRTSLECSASIQIAN
ncbi:hypothetical protein [Legionella clemsonensis]|uniref:Uncharacterized protein n=1 Tax=Legionella clemsonensis TaxID=1867846 RepID=A0A222P3F8_9GAMM|nr:hypothetical protein [Legionella clemsonensis]ASQ46362.1 hypothetical protein clem_09055 [Legionella clemsonensis]